MAWAPLLLTLLTYCSGSLSQFTLTQQPSVSVSIGNTVKLACTISSGTTFGSVVGSMNTIYWYQQKPGQAPRFVLYKTDSDKHQGSGVPSRFAGSKDASNTIGYLTITSVQAEDEADYYCGAWSSGTNLLFPPPMLHEIIMCQRVTVTLSCSLSTGAITSSNYPSWYQQKPGSALQELIYNTNTRPSVIPARFSGSISGNNAVLTITCVQAEDEADYSCAVYTGSSGSENHSDPARWGTEIKTHPFSPPAWALH
uniref:Ig-like domain-containing protein n=1 Tax=Chelonoidis abingdonii TaxID=106734 RepID=A0A8C0J2B4_CHEAB